MAEPQRQNLMISYRNESLFVGRIESRRFFKLIDELTYLFNNDCGRLADSYSIAMVFIYFMRASYTAEDYTKVNFYVALCLAHSAEDDDSEYYLDTVHKCIKYSVHYMTKSELKARRFELFKEMRYQTRVTLRDCLLVMQYYKPLHFVWSRIRPEFHAGIVHNKLEYKETEPCDCGF